MQDDDGAIRAEVARRWDAEAATFDADADHGLADPTVRAAWLERLRSWLPPVPALVADLGCGTGSLAVLIAAEGYAVRGVDLSPQMVERARAKALTTDVAVDIRIGDAGDPPLLPGSVDVVLARHLLWTLPDPAAALARWVRLLRPGGRLVLVEGRWCGVDPSDALAQQLPWAGGVAMADLMAGVRPLVARVEHIDLAGDAALWGRAVGDERYAVIGHLS